MCQCDVIFANAVGKVIVNTNAYNCPSKNPECNRKKKNVKRPIYDTALLLKQS